MAMLPYLLDQGLLIIEGTSKAKTNGIMLKTNECNIRGSSGNTNEAREWNNHYGVTFDPCQI